MKPALNPSSKDNRARSHVLQDRHIRDSMSVIPEAWLLLDSQTPTKVAKTRVTLYLDRDVLDIFRAQGKNWQARVRRILRRYLALQAQELLTEKRPYAEDIIADELDDDSDMADLEWDELLDDNSLTEEAKRKKHAVIEKFARAKQDYENGLNALLSEQEEAIDKAQYDEAARAYKEDQKGLIDAWVKFAEEVFKQQFNETMQSHLKPK